MSVRGSSVPWGQGRRVRSAGHTGPQGAAAAHPRPGPRLHDVQRLRQAGSSGLGVLGGGGGGGGGVRPTDALPSPPPLLGDAGGAERAPGVQAVDGPNAGCAAYALVESHFPGKEEGLGKLLARLRRPLGRGRQDICLGVALRREACPPPRRLRQRAGGSGHGVRWAGAAAPR